MVSYIFDSISPNVKLSHRIHVGISAVQGHRPYMEDTYSVDLSIKNRYLFAVFDGHGGKEAADFASQVLLPCVHRCVEEQGPKRGPEGMLSFKVMKNALKKAFLETDKQFLQIAHARNLPDGTTAIVAMLSGTRLVVANAGDSRGIMVTGGTMKPLSEDHKPDRPDEKRRIRYAGGTVVHADVARVQGVLSTSRAIGDAELKRWVIAEPELHHFNLTKPCYLILASDGLWDVFTNEDAARFVASIQPAGGKLDAQRSSEGLVREALHRGTMDNVTALFVDLSEYFL